MKIRCFAIIYLLFFKITGFAQNLSNDYKVLNINKKTFEIDYSDPFFSPLDNYVARIHLWVNGKYEPFYSETNYRVNKSPQPYSEKAAEKMLNSEITQVITYKDSVGLVFRKEN
ncbi:MAG: hypothetical protein LBH32_15240, partial [Dysgonamonadaceae bacterium]|nr:hypothetical protein [Dysgonamonadaceae bacterium]